MKYIYILTAIILTGCDPAKKNTAGSQGFNKGGGGPSSPSNNQDFEYPNSSHLFFDFHKNMKPLEGSLLFSTLSDELLEEYLDKKNRKYIEIFKKLQDDFIPLTNMVIKRELMQEYLSSLSLDKKSTVKMKERLIADLFNEFEQEFFHNTGAHYEYALKNYQYLVKLVSFDMNDTISHNKLLEPGGEINTYMKNVWKYIQEINADPIVVPYSNELDKYLESFKINIMVIGTPEQKNALYKKLIQLYSAKWFDDIILSKEIENAKRNKDKQVEQDFNDGKKEYKKEKPADKDWSEDIEKEYDREQKRHEKNRSNSSFRF